ncbi:MAG: hypothetical protein AAGD40_10325, partial [Pseudomonadota bacterium]
WTPEKYWPKVTCPVLAIHGSKDIQIEAKSSTSGIKTLVRSNGNEFALVEPYIPGRELTVAVLGDHALGVTELRPNQGFYDYEAKYTDGKTVHLCPAPIPDSIAQQAMETALIAHKSLGCRGVTRSDFRYDDTQRNPGDLLLLELNTQPGMTPLSLVPEQAKHAGVSFEELVSWLVENATCDA